MKAMFTKTQNVGPHDRPTWNRYHQL